MKVLYCTRCGDIRAFEEGLWTTCRCGLCAARWKDGRKGTVEILTTSRNFPRIIGLHNGFLMGAARADGVDTAKAEFHRSLHSEVTNAEGYLFDKSKRNCWACVIKIGESNDVWFSPWCSRVWSGEVPYMEALRGPFEPPPVEVPKPEQDRRAVLKQKESEGTLTKAEAEELLGDTDLDDGA